MTLHMLKCFDRSIWTWEILRVVGGGKSRGLRGGGESSTMIGRILTGGGMSGLKGCMLGSYVASSSSSSLSSSYSSYLWCWLSTIGGVKGVVVGRSRHWRLLSGWMPSFSGLKSLSVDVVGLGGRVSFGHSSISGSGYMTRAMWARASISSASFISG
jgi:hypothetical protein